MPQSFELSLATRLVHGAGSLERLGALARSIDPRDGARVLLVTDPGVAAAGHAGAAERSLGAAGFQVLRFEDVRENPTTDDVEACRKAAHPFAPDLLVGVGGGSAIDVAKGASFLLTNGGSMHDYRGRASARRPLLPLIAVPTTAGTGSEMQSFALISDARTHEKMACGDPGAAPRIALLDPELTLTLPRSVTAVSGLDALGHAVESAVTRARTPASDLFAREAFRLASGALLRVLETPSDLEARAAMLLAAAYAGIAIEASMLGAAHSMANPLTARFGIAHGQAVGTMLPHVVRFNAAEPGARAVYAELARAAGLDRPGEEPAEALARHVESILVAAGLPLALADLGVSASATEVMADEAAGQWTARFNPRAVGRADFAALFEGALGPHAPAAGGGRVSRR